MRILVLALIVVFSLAVPSIGKGMKIAEGYALLKSIRSPQELLYPHLPRKYCVPVNLSGEIAEEIGRTLDSLQLGRPTFAEQFDGRSFNLKLASRDFPATTHELLSGILNPIELIDIIVDSFVRYREENKFADIMSMTTVRTDTVTWYGNPALVVLLLPRDERFAVMYDDQGAYVHESWLSSLTLTMDAKTHLVYELLTVKNSRTYEVGSEGPETNTVHARYRFTYESHGDALVPKVLTVYFNDVEVLKVNATYRTEKKKIVFATKEICCKTGDEVACLKVDYGDYRFGKCRGLGGSGSKKRTEYAKRMRKADVLAKRANEKLRSGEITGAVSIFRKLIEDYGDTPQAIEARRLLNRLPDGLQ